MASQSQRNSRPRRTLVRRTYTIEEESFFANDSDSDFMPKKSTNYGNTSDTSDEDSPVQKLAKKTKAVPKKTSASRNTTHSMQDSTSASASSQDSLIDKSKRTFKQKPPGKGSKKNEKPVPRETFTQSRSQEPFFVDNNEEESDSSLFFTDEISEASCLLKEHPESLRKSSLLKKPHADLSQKNATTKSVKRKDLSASRKAFKKIKLNDSDEVEYIPDPVECITIESDTLSELEASPCTKIPLRSCGIKVKTERKSSPFNIHKVNKEKSQEIKALLKCEKSEPAAEEAQSSGYSSHNVQAQSSTQSMTNSRVKSEKVNAPTRVPPVKKEKDDEKSLNSRVKLEKANSSTKVPNVKKEKGEKSASQSQSKGNPKLEIKSEQNLNIKTEKQVKREVDSSAKSKVVEKRQINQKTFVFGIEWESQMLSDLMELDFFLAKNIIALFDNDCTIPFIARYRRENTNNMDADQLRQVKSAYEYIKSLEKKAVNVLKKLEATGKLTKDLENSIYHVRSIEELEYIYAPYKQASSKSKAEKARNLGLEEPALMVLNGNGEFQPMSYVNPTKEGVKSVEDVLQSAQHIMAEIFSKDEAVLDFIRKIENQIPILIKSSKKKGDDVDDENGKFRIYYDFTKHVRDLQSHQILALNRGENLKILSVKMTVDESFYDKLYRFCSNKWLRYGRGYPLRGKMFEDSFKDSYTRLICPLLIRRTKAKLTRKAQETAIENFALNLKSLLQTPPVKGYPILGIDPGLRHGVKFAMISSQGDVLWTCILNFDLKNPDSRRNEQNMNKIKKNMVQHRCELLAIGNGCGSREIEAVISDYLKKNFFCPELNVSYTFVNERGASIYSCGSIANEEFPNLDPNLISAVFIARSLQDPLNEFVKVEPKHLGVGMYQHDMPEVRLNQSLDEVVMECVSFTGVDLNIASIYLLKRVSGLGATRAANIIKWRHENGPFKNRQQLTKVKMIGPKTFEQCSGFLRIHPQTCNVQPENLKKKGIPGNDDYNPLDSTWIHPESYSIAYLFIGHCDSNISDLGTTTFIERIKRVVQLKGLKSISDILGQSESTISLIYDALIKPRNYDYRSEFSKPVFSTGLRSMDSLKVGDILQGVISNVVAFGAFVDIGVGKDGLVHIRNMNRMKVQIGDRVEVRILSVEKDSGRIGLFLVNKN